MTFKLVVLLLLAIAALLAAWRSYRRIGKATAFAVWSQPLLAALFFGLLFPPSLSVRDDVLTVLTADHGIAQSGALPLLQRTIALPEAEAGKNIERAPDLATALRRYLAVDRITVIGAGLSARDQEAVGTRGLQFDATPERGLVELHAPARAAQGTQWSLSGRALAPAIRVELRDPAGATVDAAALALDGSFRLSALARAAGTARYELRLIDAKQALVDTASIPLLITEGEALRAIIRAGAPDPEFKYWRRWAADAGIAVQASAGLSEAVSLRDGDTRLTPAALAAADLVIIDERAWTTLDADEKSALGNAVSAGLGLLLRIGGAIEPAVAADWAALGIRVSNGDGPRSVTMDQHTGMHERAAFTAAPVAVEVKDATPLITADDGDVLLSWRAEGRGRIGISRLIDSYRLGLLGEPARYASLWQSTLAALTRPRPAERLPTLPDAAWIDERSVICGLGQAATVRAPNGSSATLIVDAQGCAGYWPAEAGWHRLQSEAASMPFYVRAADDARGLRAARDRAATLALVRASEALSPAPMREASLPRWPFFLAWLVLAALLWWRERPR